MFHWGRGALLVAGNACPGTVDEPPPRSCGTAKMVVWWTSPEALYHYNPFIYCLCWAPRPTPVPH